MPSIQGNYIFVSLINITDFLQAYFCYREAFFPFLEKSFEVTIKLLRYPQEDIRKAAIDGLTQFSISFSKINSEEGKQATLKALNIFIPKLSEIIRLDEEKSVVISGLDAYSEILRELGSVALLGNGHKEAIMNCVNDVMKGKLYIYIIYFFKPIMLEIIHFNPSNYYR